MHRIAAAVLAFALLAACNSSDAPPKTSSPRSTAGRAAQVTTTALRRVREPGDVGVVTTSRGIVAPILAADAAGWMVRTPCGRTARVARSAGSETLDADVVVDAGHGGRESGAIGNAGTAEKDVNLIVARLVVDALRAQGVVAMPTRTADYRVTLFSRAVIARSLNARAFVSIHFNADPDGASPKPGTETYYQLRSAQSKRLAGVIYETLVPALAEQHLPWVADTDAGAKYRPNVNGDDYYAVLRHTGSVPATIVESAFISNPSEERFITSAAGQTVIANAVASSVVRYLSTNEPGSGFVEPYARDTAVGQGDVVPPSCVDAAM